MSKIRWENNGECGSDNEWRGYLGKALICRIEWNNELSFDASGDWYCYTKLSSAKRGAERLLDKFLRDAGLEVKDA